MADRICRKCGEEFYAEGREKLCRECADEPRDLVDELNRSEAGRLARGLRQMNNAGR